MSPQTDVRPVSIHDLRVATYNHYARQLESDPRDPQWGAPLGHEVLDYTMGAHAFGLPLAHYACNPGDPEVPDDIKTALIGRTLLPRTELNVEGQNHVVCEISPAKIGDLISEIEALVLVPARFISTDSDPVTDLFDACELLMAWEDDFRYAEEIVFRLNGQQIGRRYLLSREQMLTLYDTMEKSTSQDVEKLTALILQFDAVTVQQLDRADSRQIVENSSS